MGEAEPQTLTGGVGTSSGSITQALAPEKSCRARRPLRDVHVPRSSDEHGYGAGRRVDRFPRSFGLLPKRRHVDAEALAPAADLDRGLVHAAGDGGDVAAVAAEAADEARAELEVFGG